MTDTTTAAAGSGSAAGPGARERSRGRFRDRFRDRISLRGWGGVGGMAAVCALTAVTLLPLSRGAGNAVTGPGPGSGSARSAALASPAAAGESCTAPETSLPPSTAGGPNIAEIEKRGKLIVGVDQNSYRWGYRDPVSDDLKGFDIDLARAIAENILGSRDAVIFRAIPTNQRIPALNSDTVDLVVRTMTINCARAEQVAFSTAYFEVGQQVLASKGSDITGYDASLKGKRVCSAEGSTAYEALEKNAFGAVFRDAHDGGPADEDILTVPNQLDCLVRLQEGLADAVVTDNALAAGQAAQDPAVELKGRRFTSEYYGVAAKLGKDDLVRRVNHVLEEYREAAWKKAYRHWLADDLPGISGPPAPKYRQP
ncbi:sugar-binding protein [Streptomyces inusitatus]|uniref:Sugar-binding protein n=1 Tax=Streptomyces inusitatus TaxID=68221 RepID=A0A918PZR8_9ACTN|nr:glutamate ABC transporter substrate-binding protein [Streptomyces inusitatus]GGZ26827.1 sugar-binding protein [Streptomyces inusitatus]